MLGIAPDDDEVCLVGEPEGERQQPALGQVADVRRQGGRVEVVAEVDEESGRDHDDYAGAAGEQPRCDELGGAGEDKSGHGADDAGGDAAG